MEICFQKIFKYYPVSSSEVGQIIYLTNIALFIYNFVFVEFSEFINLFLELDERIKVNHELDVSATIKNLYALNLQLYVKF